MRESDERVIANLQRQIDRLASLLDELKSGEAPAYPARYQTNAGQSIPNASPTIVNYEDVTYDPYSLVTTGANWKYTAPVAGYYAITASVLMNATATWADTEYVYLAVYKNGLFLAALNYNTGGGSASSIYKNATGITIVRLAESDYIDIRVEQTSGATLALNAGDDINHVSIWKIQ